MTECKKTKGLENYTTVIQIHTDISFLTLGVFSSVFNFPKNKAKHVTIVFESGLFCLIWCPPTESNLLQTFILHLQLSPLSIYAKCSLPIHLIADTLVDSKFWLLCTVLLETWWCSDVSDLLSGPLYMHAVQGSWSLWQIYF